MHARRKLPPLNALRVFEVAARYQSFTRAAEELGVTQTAVSKQVAQLEDYLECQLFFRQHRTLSLTQEGEICADGITQSFDHLERKIRSLTYTGPLRVSILADVDFARLWLFPILPNFERRFPEVLISLDTKNFTLPINSDEDFDIAISWGRGKWKTLAYEPLFTNEVFPVCAPDFFSSDPDMADLNSAQLIHDRNTYWWRVFLERLGAENLNAEGGRHFSQTSLCLDAAARGDGITIGDEATTRSYLENGTLITPFTERLPSADAYYILTRKQHTFRDDPIYLIRNWLVEEATRHRLWFSQYWAISEKAALDRQVLSLGPLE